MADYSMANRKIAYTLGRGWAYISDTSATCGYMGEKHFQEFGPRFFDMSSASGYMGEKYFQEFGPSFFLTYPQLVGTWVQHIFMKLVPDFWRVMLFLACHVLNVACHGVSISIVSIISVSCRVRILRVIMFMPCRGHLVCALLTQPCVWRTSETALR